MFMTSVMTNSVRPMANRLLTAAMVQLANSDITGSGAAFNSLFAIGLTLFVITLVVNIVSDLIAERYREQY